MSEGADLLARVRIASPCTASWDAMEGDERVRFCRLCSLHVYNLSEMTRAEAAALVARTEGRLCARLYRRADGTLLTRDCPTGLRAARRRVSRAAGAALTALLSLCTFGLGQEKGKGKPAESCDTGAVKVFRLAKTEKGPTLKGTVFDPTAATITGAQVVVTDSAGGKKYEATTTAEGAFEFAALPPGTYEISVTALYFKNLKLTSLSVVKGEAVKLELSLDPNVEVLTGVVAVDISLPVEQKSNGITIFSSKEIESLPPE